MIVVVSVISSYKGRKQTVEQKGKRVGDNRRKKPTARMSACHVQKIATAHRTVWSSTHTLIDSLSAYTDHFAKVLSVPEPRTVFGGMTRP